MSVAPGSTPKPVTAETRKGPKRRIPAWWIAISCAGAVALMWFVWGRLHPADPGLGVMVTGTVKRGDLLETVTATGSIAAQTGAQVKIGSQITGRIKRLYADVGKVVKAGDLIAELDLPDVDAQLVAAKANHSAALSKVVQQEQNVTLSKTQTFSGVGVAQAGVESATERLKAARAALELQAVQTPADIRRAEAVLSQAKATLSTSQSNLTQVQAGANLQIQNAIEAVTQAQATDARNQADLVRQQALGDKGYVAGTIVDLARQAATVSQSQVRASQKTLELTKQKVTADLQSATDLVTQAQQTILSAKAALAAAKAETFSVSARAADVADAEAAIKQANANLRLATGNLTGNAIKVQDVQQALDSVNQAAAQIAVNQAQVAKTTIRSPISGTVLQLAAQQGETLAAGLSAPTLIIVADLKRLEVDAYVDETDIGKVKLGQPVQITVDAFPDEIMSGKVAKVASGSTIQQGVVTYGVTVYIDDTTHELKPDMTASVVIQTGKISNVLVVPAVAVQIGVKGSTVNTLAKVDGKSVLKPVPVKTGGTDGVNVEIQSGLIEGQTIVLAGGQSGPRRTSGNSPFSSGGGPGGGGGRPGG